MSADLKELLSREAQRVHPSPAPIDAVLTDVRTRIRHRRMGATAVAAALAVLAVAGPWAISWVGEGSTVDRPADAVMSDPSWGPYRVGDTIYLGDQAELTNKHLADPMAEVPRGLTWAGAAETVDAATPNVNSAAMTARVIFFMLLSPQGSGEPDGGAVDKSARQALCRPEESLPSSDRNYFKEPDVNALRKPTIRTDG